MSNSAPGGVPLRSWIFQNRPDRYNLGDALARSGNDDWTVSSHRTEISNGDVIYFWRSGPEAGIVAIGHATSAVFHRGLNDFGEYAVRVVYDWVIDPPLDRLTVLSNPVLSSVRVFTRAQGTNFPLSDSETKALESLLASRKIAFGDYAPPQWRLQPGDSILRTQLHEEYGGRRYGGISPSRSSPNIMLFSDSATGAEHGYVDGWKGPRRFDYTGEGQRGDQLMNSGNLQILRHREDRRALRLFEGTGGVVKYVGEFRIDQDDPHEFVDAAETGGGPVRSAILFHLQPIEFHDIAESSETIVNVVVVDDVPVEEQYSESFSVLPVNERTSLRRESALVKRFKAFMEQRGHTVRRKRIRVPGSAQPLFTDLFIADLNLLLEAKGSISRQAFRSAVGQLLDYGRFLQSPSCGVLLPRRPSEDTLAFARHIRFAVYWEAADGTFESEQML